MGRIRTGRCTPRPTRSRALGWPSTLRESQFWVVTAVFVIQPDESGRGAVDGVSDVVHRPAVTVVPRIRDPQRSFVVAKEIAAQLATCLALKGNPGGVLDHEEANRVRKRSLPGGRRRQEFTRIRRRRLLRFTAGSLSVDRRRRCGEVNGERQSSGYDRLPWHGSNLLLSK